MCYLIVIILISFQDYGQSEVILDGSKSLLSMKRKPCSIPDSMEYYYMNADGERMAPIRSVAGDGKLSVKVKCYHPTKIVNPDDFAVCFDGKWYPSHHTCVHNTTCPGVFDTYSTIYTCTTPGGAKVSCSSPAVPGTKIAIRCASSWYSKPNTVQERFCLLNGTWEKIEFCTSECSLIFKDGINTNYSNLKELNVFPWDAVIYRYKDNQWHQICVGTVMSIFTIITSSNCFREGSEKVGQLRVTIGKYFMDYRNNTSADVYDVEKVFLSNPHSIALITVSKYIEFSDTVGQICIGGTTKDLDFNGEFGKILVWKQGDNGSFAREAKLLQCVSNQECQSSKVINEEIRANEFCSLSNNHSFVHNDIGSGLVFFRKVEDRFRYVLDGILSSLFNNGKIPIFMELWTEKNAFFMLEKEKEFNEWLKKNHKYPFRNRKRKQPS